MWTHLRKAGLACGLVLAVLIVVQGCGKAPAFAPPPPPKVQVANPTVQDVVLYFEVPGRLKAMQSVAIPARVQGFIKEIKFKDGEFVEKDQSLFMIEPEQYDAAVAQAKAAVAAAEAANVSAAASVRISLIMIRT